MKMSVRSCELLPEAQNFFFSTPASPMSPLQTNLILSTNNNNNNSQTNTPTTTIAAKISQQTNNLSTTTDDSCVNQNHQNNCLDYTIVETAQFDSSQFNAEAFACSQRFYSSTSGAQLAKETIAQQSLASDRKLLASQYQALQNRAANVVSNAYPSRL